MLNVNYFINKFSNKILVESGRKTGFLGFLLNMKAINGIFNNNVGNGALEYLLAFKLS